MGHFTFWISFSLRPKTETKPLNFGLTAAGVEFNQSAQLVIADVIGNSSLISPYFFVKVCL